MISRTKRRLVLFIILSVALVGVMLFLWFDPSLWAKEIAVEPGMNRHLAAFSGLTVEDAVYEAVHWDAPREDLTPRDRVKISARQSGSGGYVARVMQSPQDDSYERFFYELTLEHAQGTWKVVRVKRCWRGRGLWGWSTETPS